MITRRLPLLFLLTSLAGCPRNDLVPTGSEGGSGSSETTDEPTGTTGPDLCGNAECDPGEAQSCPGDCEGCGDGMVAGSEVCDDGPDNSDEPWSETKRCKADCQGYTEYCGDGTCQPEFEDEQSCTEDLCAATCGDGKIEGDEACDDGNDDETDACLNNCEKARCGDGVVLDGTEECDDGNAIQNDACLATCVAATCGDGILQEGVEPCDDGNDVETDECDSACKVVEHRRVFVSSMKYDGDFGGLAGDTICQVLGGSIKYKVWLSDSISSPVNKFDTDFTGVYELTNGEFIAKGWADLTNGVLEHAINQTETGSTVPASAVWSNTKVDGTPLGALHCDNWSDGTANQDGSVGISDGIMANWTDNAKSQGCSSPARLYCFEDL